MHGDSAATLYLEATLPLPEGPPAAPEVPGGTPRPLARPRILALLPELLSEHLYPRIEPAE
jgi:hypothetical protein